MYKNYEILINDDAKIQKYIDFIRLYGPYRFFATLTFQYALTDEEGIKHASEHIKRFLKKLFGRHWQKHGIACLTGIATLEHASILKQDKDSKRSIKDGGTCHFHFLLKDHPSLHKDPLAALRQVAEAWETSARSLNYKISRKLVSTHGTDVQLIQTDGIYGYVLKEGKNPVWKYQERLFYLDKEGLLAVDAGVI
jgi:hypothetical protein